MAALTSGVAIRATLIVVLTRFTTSALIGALSMSAALVACSPNPTAGGDAGGGGGDGGGAPDSGVLPLPDFPAEPIIEPGAPANAQELFGDPASGTPGGPCVLEPAPGALFPSNWLRLLVSVSAPGQNLFEIRMHVDGFAHDLVVYTPNPEWKMPLAMWQGLTRAVAPDDRVVSVTVRGAIFDGTALSSGPFVGTPSSFTVAPVVAPGSIVYWTSSGGTALKGFTVGDESVHDVLRPPQAETACVGCHNSTPDGLFVGFSAASDPNGGNPARVGLRAVDGSLAEPSFLTSASRELLARTSQQQPVFSAAHWQTGDRVGISALQQGGVWELGWTDLEAASTAQGVGHGVLARQGDGNMAAAAAWSHDGATVIYTSAAYLDGENATSGGGDIRAIPYANRQGGLSTPIAGASDPAFNEGYASFSPDDRYIAFSRVGNGESTVANPNSEVLIVPAGGGGAIRVLGNEPAACTGRASPGVTNSWPKWAPEAGASGDRTYYWLTFSSTRGVGGNPQLYVAGVRVNGDGSVITYPAIYLWNQPAGENNHTPAWDVFQIPIP